MITETELKNEINRGQFRPVYVLSGEDNYLVKTYTDKLKQAIAGDNPDFNLVCLPDGVTTDRIFESIMQVSFTGERVGVVVTNFNFESCPIAEFKSLVNVIETAPQSNSLILCFDAVEFNPKKSDRYKKLTAATEKNGGAVCRFEHKSEAQLVKMLCDGAARRGKTLTPKNAAYMIQVCSNNLNILINELDKLAAYAQTAEIDQNMIDLVCTKTVDVSLYDLAKYILSGNGEKAIALLHDLAFMGITPVEILANITGVYVDIYRAKAATQSGKDITQAAAAFGYAANRTFVLKNAARDAKNISAQKLTKILNLLLEADKAVKGESKINAGSGTAYLEYLITKLIIIARG